MWIKLKDLGLVNIDHLECIDYKEREIRAYFILPSYGNAAFSGDSYLIIGRYANTERAEEVMKEIGEAISTGSALYQMPDL